jgi:hypothetical protein
MALIDSENIDSGTEEAPPPLTTLHGPLADHFEEVYLERRARDSMRYRPRPEVSQARPEPPAEGTTARVREKEMPAVSQTRRSKRKPKAVTLISNPERKQQLQEMAYRLTGKRKS